MLRLTTQTAGANARALRQGRKIGVFARKHAVGRRFALGDAAQYKPLGQFHGHVLDAVHGKVGPVVQQSFFNFFHKQALAAHLGQGNILNDVALGFDDDKINSQLGIQRQQTAFDVFCLPESQLTATGGDSE